MFIFILSLFAVGIRKTISTPSTRRNGKKNKRFTTDHAQYQYNNAKKLGLGLPGKHMFMQAPHIKAVLNHRHRDDTVTSEWKLILYTGPMDSKKLNGGKRGHFHYETRRL